MKISKTSQLAAMLCCGAALACAASASRAPEGTTGEQWSIDHLFTRPFIWGSWPSQIAWAKRAHIVGFLWNAKGETFKDLYVYNADTQKLTRLTDLEGLKDPINESEAERDVHRKQYIVPPAGIVSFDLSEDGSKAVFSYRGDLYLAHTAGG